MAIEAGHRKGKKAHGRGDFFLWHDDVVRPVLKWVAEKSAGCTRLVCVLARSGAGLVRRFWLRVQLSAGSCVSTFFAIFALCQISTSMGVDGFGRAYRRDRGYFAPRCLRNDR